MAYDPSMFPIEVVEPALDPFNSPQVWASVITSVLAFVAAVIAAIVAVHQGKQTRLHADKLHEADLQETQRKERVDDQRFRDFTGRDQWWREFTWAVEKLHQPDEGLRSSALSVLKHLSKAPWVGSDEKRTIANILVPRSPKSGGGK